MVHVCNYKTECNREAATTVTVVSDGIVTENVRVCQQHADAPGVIND